VSGQIGILVALVALTIVLAGVFLVRPSFTLGATGKILAFVGLCVLPALCIGTGMSFHMQRSQQTAYCVSCHSMESHGQSLYVLNASYIPARHFQNHLVSPDKACYTCHTDYTMYGPLKDKIKGLGYLYMEYVSTPPKTIHLDGKYSNLQCLHCHTGMRSFDENPTHTAIMGSLRTNRISCLSCHNMIHNASEVGHMKMWVDGDAPTPVAAADAPPAAGPAVPAGPARAPAINSPGAATAALGKNIFVSQGCGGCHGESGGGASGPPLTHVSSQYPPAQLTAILKTPTAPMKAAGMVPLSLNAADMKSLVSYVSSLGGPLASPAPSSSRPSPPAIAKAQPGAAPGPPKVVSATVPQSAESSSPAPATAEPPAAAGPAPAGNSAGAATTLGKSIFESQGCGGCHGEAGVGGSGPALTHTSSQYPPAQLTAALKTPTAQMKAAGMVPLMVNAADMEALVSYVSSLGGTPAASAAPPPTAGSSPSAPAKAGPVTATGPSTPPTGNSAVNATAVRGKTIFDAQGCSGCHGEAGEGGTGPALFHLPSQYSPAQVAAVRKGMTAVLKAPTTKMKAAGMVPLTLNNVDMDDLVSYMSSPGGISPAPAAPPPASGSSSARPATAGPIAAAPSKPESKGRAILGWISVFLPYPHGTPPTAEPAAATGPSVAAAGSSADAASAGPGKDIFESQGCGGCHGESGGGGSGPALTHTSSQYPPAQLTVILKTPTAAMKAAGMVPLDLNAADMKSLVSYVTSLGATSVASAPAPPVSSLKSQPQQLAIPPHTNH
jgi:mono/diheme cytochrome c family protein/nitrate/TMAO reductase-like tetraheme cytochrome c subunit